MSSGFSRAKKLRLGYNDQISNPNTAILKGGGDCVAGALIARAMEPRAAILRLTSKPDNDDSWRSMVHYIAASPTSAEVAHIGIQGWESRPVSDCDFSYIAKEDELWAQLITQILQEREEKRIDERLGDSQLRVAWIDPNEMLSVVSPGLSFDGIEEYALRTLEDRNK